MSRDVVEDIWVILKRKQSQMVELTDKHNFSELQQRSILIEIREQKLTPIYQFKVQTHILVSYSSSLILLPSPAIYILVSHFFSNMYCTWKRVQLWHRSRNLLATQCFCSGKYKEKAKQTICFEINFNIALKVQILVIYSL